MSSKSEKKNEAKKLKVRKIIRTILVCVIIQAAMLYTFLTFLPDKEPIDSSDLQGFTITVENTKYVNRTGKRTADHFEVYSGGVCYRFRDRVFGEPGPGLLSKRIQAGDTITVLCVKNESKYESLYPCDWIIYDAFSDTEVYRDVDKLHKDQKVMRPTLIVGSIIFELVFLLLVAGYFYLFLGSASSRKKKQKPKAKADNGFLS